VTAYTWRPLSEIFDDEAKRHETRAMHAIAEGKLKLAMQRSAKAARSRHRAEVARMVEAI